MKKGSLSITVTVWLIVLLLFVIVFSATMLTKLNSSNPTNMKVGCKPTSVYYDAVSNNVRYAYVFYQEFVECSYKNTEPKSIVEGWKRLKLKPYGMLNLIESYCQSGLCDVAILKDKNKSLLAETKKEIENNKELQNKLIELQKKYSKLK